MLACKFDGLRAVTCKKMAPIQATGVSRPKHSRIVRAAITRSRNNDDPRPPNSDVFIRRVPTTLSRRTRRARPTGPAGNIEKSLCTTGDYYSIFDLE
jgi:hypothetical protein